ncbi:MAG: glycosyltransferase family protein [Alkalispirochaeta sp.]
MITVLALYDRISIFHTLAPWIVGLHRDGWAAAREEVGGALSASPPRITLTDDPDWCLNRDRNEYLIIVRRYLKPPVTDLEQLARFRARYRRIFFLNGNAGGGLHRPEVLPYVDRFYNKALFMDPSHYQYELYGGELFTHHNHGEYGVEDPQPVIPRGLSQDEIQKIHLHWNIGIGDFPRRKVLQRAAVAFARAPGGPLLPARAVIHRREMLDPVPPPEISEAAVRYDVNARLGAPGYPTIAYHRATLTRALDVAAQRQRWSVARDRVPPRRYLSDMRRSRITFSPFGWGEVCFRDFEAVRAGSLLVKPDMSHLRTWPDIFVPGETYVPIRWDGSDLEETLAYYLEHENERHRIAAEAHARFRAQLADVPRRAAQLLAELVHE